ncbi:hypothetical protein ACQKK5_07890 [Brevibacillus panacihumi]|uniref:hypothetical protein n=1 Tax=Brevibacillus panacihumi TaxID=497735 RepID=UPI003CFFE8CA
MAVGYVLTEESVRQVRRLRMVPSDRPRHVFGYVATRNFVEQRAEFAVEVRRVSVIDSGRNQVVRIARIARLRKVFVHKQERIVLARMDALELRQFRVQLLPLIHVIVRQVARVRQPLVLRDHFDSTVDFRLSRRAIEPVTVEVRHIMRPLPLTAIPPFLSGVRGGLRATARKMRRPS